jgi:hypothetical protein
MSSQAATPGFGQAGQAAKPRDLGHPEAFGPQREFEFQFLIYFQN